MGKPETQTFTQLWACSFWACSEPLEAGGWEGRAAAVGSTVAPHMGAGLGTAVVPKIVWPEKG